MSDSDSSSCTYTGFQGGRPMILATRGRAGSVRPCHPPRMAPTTAIGAHA